MNIEKELEDLKVRMNEVAGQWNGDEPGQLEEKATLAYDIINKATELQSLLSDYKEIQ